MSKILLQINVSANWGSTGKIAESIGLAAIKRGWESHIAYGRFSNTSQSHLIKIGTKIDPYLHYIHQRIFDDEGLCSKKATRLLIKTIKDLGPDVVQLHNIHDHYLNYQLLFEYLNHTDIKVVWTFHDCWAFTGHCFHFITKKCERWKTECYDCPLQHEYPKTLLDHSNENFSLKKNLFSNNKDLSIVACSEWMAQFVRESFLQDKPLYAFHNGVDLNMFKAMPAMPNEKGQKIFKVLAVSNVWNKDKGIDDILALRNLLPEEYAMTIVGLNDEQLKKLPLSIKGIQRTQNVQELVKLYSEADVLINPTYADTFPTVNLEALACGTPVITYRTGGSPEAIDEKTGVVVGQGDGKALADAIVRMKEHPLASSDCRKRAEEKFDKDKCFERYIELYEKLLK